MARKKIQREKRGAGWRYPMQERMALLAGFQRFSGSLYEYSKRVPSLCKGSWQSLVSCEKWCSLFAQWCGRCCALLQAFCAVMQAFCAVMQAFCAVVQAFCAVVQAWRGIVRAFSAGVREGSVIIVGKFQGVLA